MATLVLFLFCCGARPRLSHLSYYINLDLCGCGGHCNHSNPRVVYGSTFRRRSVFPGKFVPKSVETVDLTQEEDQPALNLHLSKHKKPLENNLAPRAAAAAANEDPSRGIIEEELIQINASNDVDLLGNDSTVSDSTAVSEQPQVPSKVVVVRPVATSTPHSISSVIFSILST